MKLSPRDASAYFARPDANKAGLLIYGPDAMRVALKRQQVVAALVGPDGADEMRLDRLAPADVRKDPAMLLDAMRAQGFFPGQRVVFLDAAPDTIAKIVSAALDDWQAGDAQIVITAGNLTKGSALRKLFEAHRNAYAAAVYADPPSRAEIEQTLAQAGLSDLSQDAQSEIAGLAETLDPGDFAQTVEKLAIYKIGDGTAVSSADIDAIAPLSTEAGIQDVIHVVADGRVAELGPLMRRVEAQGIQPVALCIAANRHFKSLFSVAAHPGGASEGIARLRPPVFGPQRNRLQRQAQTWGTHRLEQGLQMLVETDLSLRSGGATAPQAAVIERCLFRLCFLGASAGGR